MKLDGSIAVVTGGARGIGKAITKALLQNQAKVLYNLLKMLSQLFKNTH
jgi:NAD(P)-dependent dehydrogenase (short-subunit alcohol dehydrogenase family)